MTHFSYWGLEIFLKHPKYMHMTQNYLFVIKCRINYLLMSNLKGIFFSILFHMQPRVTYYDLLVQHIVKNRKIIYIWSQYLVIWYLFSYVIENISHFRIFIKKKMTDHLNRATRNWRSFRGYELKVKVGSFSFYTCSNIRFYL